MAPESLYLVRVAAVIAAGVCMGIGALGPALGQGFVGGKACESIGRRPESANMVKSTMMIAMIFVETSGIFCFLISLLLIFVVG